MVLCVVTLLISVTSQMLRVEQCNLSRCFALISYLSIIAVMPKDSDPAFLLTNLPGFLATACWGLWDHFVLVIYLFIYLCFSS